MIGEVMDPRVVIGHDLRGGTILDYQAVSRKCPIGHALDISFENRTSS